MTITVGILLYIVAIILFVLAAFGVAFAPDRTVAPRRVERAG